MAVWPSLNVVNSCARHGYRAVARNHALHQAAHGFEAERQRDHIQQQPVFARRPVAGQQVRLQRGAQRDHLIGIQVGQRRRAEHLAHGRADHGHARGPAHHHHAAHVGGTQLGIAQGAARAIQRAQHQGLGQRFELLPAEREVQLAAIRQGQAQTRIVGVGQRFTRRTRRHQQRAAVGGGSSAEPRPLAAWSAISASKSSPPRAVAAGGDHFEHALRQAQDGYVERAAPRS